MDYGLFEGLFLLSGIKMEHITDYLGEVFIMCFMHFSQNMYLRLAL